MHQVPTIMGRCDSGGLLMQPLLSYLYIIYYFVQNLYFDHANGLFSGLPRGKYEFAGLAHHPAGEVHLSECFMGLLALVFRVQCCPRTRELLGQPSFSTGKHRGRESKQPKPYDTPCRFMFFSSRILLLKIEIFMFILCQHDECI